MGKWFLVWGAEHRNTSVKPVVHRICCCSYTKLCVPWCNIKCNILNQKLHRTGAFLKAFVSITLWLILLNVCWILPLPTISCTVKQRLCIRGNKVCLQEGPWTSHCMYNRTCWKPFSSYWHAYRYAHLPHTTFGNSSNTLKNPVLWLLYRTICEALLPTGTAAVLSFHSCKQKHVGAE